MAAAKSQDSTLDWYDILQVSRQAEREVIEAAYIRLAQKYHPDQNRDPSAAERMQMLNRAYEVLSDPQKRHAYDQARYGDAGHATPVEAATRKDREGSKGDSVGTQAQRSLRRLWTTAAVVCGLVGPAAAPFILADMPSTPEWTGTVPVISRTTGEELVLPAEEAQVEFLSGKVGLHPGQTVDVTMDGSFGTCPAEHAQEALTDGWHLSTQGERAREIDRRGTAYWTAVAWAFGTPLVAFALFRWGLWLFA